MDEGEGKKEVAWKLSDAFLHGVYGEPLFEGRYDRAMCVMIVVVRFLMMENISPESFLTWLQGKVSESLTEVESDERRTSCH